MKRLRRWLVAGLLVWLPLYVTYFLVTFAVGIMDNQLAKFIGRLPADIRANAELFLLFPGLGVIFTFLLLLLTGFAFSMMGFALDRVLNPRLQDMD